jgi:hypothetical protein
MSENGPAMRWYNRLFLQALCAMNLLSENVYVSGLTALWPKITRIPNIPLAGAAGSPSCFEPTPYAPTLVLIAKI